MLRLLDLFSGIGGFSLAASWTNQIKTVAFCEIDPFCQKVLKKHWPNVPIFDDITRLRGDDIGTADIITGGFPCQPFSCAGKRKGKDDNRFLWPEMFRVISELHPTWVVAENVGGFLTIDNGLVFEHCCTDLEREGYEVQAFVIPACAVGAPHRRDRVWIVANSERHRFNGKEISVQSGQSRQEGTLFARADCHATNTNDQRLQGHGKHGECSGQCVIGQGTWQEPWIEAATRLCRVDARVSNRVDRLKSLGNAIVPQVAYQIFIAIVDVENKCGGLF